MHVWNIFYGILHYINTNTVELHKYYIVLLSYFDTSGISDFELSLTIKCCLDKGGSVARAELDTGKLYGLP